MATAGHLLPSFRAAPTASKALSSAPHNPSPGQNLGPERTRAAQLLPGAVGIGSAPGTAAGGRGGEKAGRAHSPSFLTALGSKQQAAALQDDPCERVWELLLAWIQALLGQQPPCITPELTKTSSVALVCGTEPSDTAPPAQDGCALPVPWQGWSWGHREPRLLLLVSRGTGGLLVVPARSWHPHSVIFPGSAPPRSSSVFWCSPGRPDTTANL